MNGVTDASVRSLAAAGCGSQLTFLSLWGECVHAFPVVCFVWLSECMFRGNVLA